MARRMMRSWGWLIAAAVLVSPVSARAEETKAPAAAARSTCPICGRANNPNAHYSEKMVSTLARGATNTVFGWTELLRQPVEEAKTGGNVFTGISRGVSHSIRRTMKGVTEVLTFWTPKTNKGEYVQFSTDCALCMKNHH